MTLCDLDVTFDLAIVDFKKSSGSIIKTIRYRRLILGRNSDRSCV